MAKKSRRVRKKGHPARLSPAQMMQPGTEEKSEVLPVAAPVRPVPRTPDLGEEYRYVVTDLKRIGIIAAVMLALLIVLALALT